MVSILVRLFRQLMNLACDLLFIMVYTLDSQQAGLTIGKRGCKKKLDASPNAAEILST